MQVAIVKYNAGNIFSVVNALRRLGIEPLLTDSAEALQQADRVLFPGQGEARGAMEYLKARRLDEVIRSLPARARHLRRPTTALPPLRRRLRRLHRNL